MKIDKLEKEINFEGKLKSQAAVLELADRMDSKSIVPKGRVGSTPTCGTNEKKSMIGGSPRFARRPNYTGFSSQNLIFGFVPASLAIKENFKRSDFFKFVNLN